MENNKYDENVDEDVLNEELNADGDDGEDGDGDLVGNERDLERKKESYLYY